MPQSLHVAYAHLIFSTKERIPMITVDINSSLFEYMGGIVRDLDGRCIEINGTEDHVHLLIRASKSVPDTKFIQELKGGSSRWINESGAKETKFQWQAGYGWFSVSPSQIHAVRSYIRNQKEHHQTTTFQDEFRKILEKCEVDYDERYVWD